MPNINFTKFVDKVESGEKLQTIRPAGKRIYKPGDRLGLWGVKEVGIKEHERWWIDSKGWPSFTTIKAHTRKIRYKLGKAVISDICIILLYFHRVVYDQGIKTPEMFMRTYRSYQPHFSIRELALMDGFKHEREFTIFFINTYKLKLGDSKEFVIIKWRDFVPAKRSK